MSHGISVICLVYNEQERITRFIKSFQNYNEIIVIDKSSTDETAKIATSLGVKVITIPYTDKSDVWKVGINIASFDWVFLLTASDVVHPKFTQELYLRINDPKFNFDIIYYPCIMHILGIRETNSRKKSSYRKTLSKKDVLVIKNRVHEEITFTSKKIYYFPSDSYIAVHHLSHESVDIYYERQLRYSKQEIEEKNWTYKKCLRAILSQIYNGIRNEYWKQGWEGLGLLLRVIDYRIIIYLRLLERAQGNVKEKYNQFAEQLLNEK